MQRSICRFVVPARGGLGRIEMFPCNFVGCPLLRVSAALVTGGLCCLRRERGGVEERVPLHSRAGALFPFDGEMVYDIEVDDIQKGGHRAEMREGKEVAKHQKLCPYAAPRALL